MSDCWGTVSSDFRILVHTITDDSAHIYFMCCTETRLQCQESAIVYRANSNIKSH